jgi:uncharacterized protein YdeI (YjbR/CyaY-like superfamily)
VKATPKASFAYVFEGVLEELRIGKEAASAMSYWVVFLPPRLQKQAPFAARKKLRDALTPGKQRGLAHMVGTLKRPELRAQRAVEVMRAVEDGNVPGPPKRRRA